MVKLATIIGARPQIIKAAAISRAINNHFKNKIKEIIIHTGQHYDENMSQVFIDELDVPKPEYNLGVGSASHGIQTARMIEGIEDILLKTRPDFLILYGDTNSTLAGAVAASKIHIPVVHIEAGLRSFNKTMPEEINRITCDHASSLLFTPTKTGYNNLIREGFKPDNVPPFNIKNPGIFHCGDVMYDNSIYYSEKAENRTGLLKKLSLKPSQYILSTIHRDNNTDDPKRLSSIFKAFNSITESDNYPIVIPMHPRTEKMLPINLGTKLFNKIQKNKKIIIIQPVSFLDIIILEKYSKMIMTDSGGVQKEAYFFSKPSLILRSETEWKEIVDNKTAIVTDAKSEKIIHGYKHFKAFKGLVYPQIFGDGHAAEFICNQIIKSSKKKM